MPPSAPASVSSLPIAVLPFTNLTNDPAKDYFPDGMAEEMGHSLGAVRALRVTPYASCLEWKGRTGDPAELGAALGVETILEGAVRRTGENLYVEARLQRLSDGSTLWSENLDRSWGDVFTVQGTVVGQVLKTLGIAPSPEEERALSRVPTTKVTAYDALLRGRNAARQLLKREQDRAMSLFGEACAADPRYAESHAELAICHGTIYQYWDSSDEQLRQAEASSREAVSLAPDLPRAHIARGLALSLGKQYDEAAAEFGRAIALAPESFDAHYFLARSYRAHGQFAEATASFERASALRPDDYATPALLASAYVSLNRPEDALATRRRSVELAEHHIERHPDDSRALYLAAACLSTLGEGTKARSWAKRALAMDPDDSAVLYNVACVYALLGLDDSAIDCLEQAIVHGFRHWDWIEHDSDFDALRKHPRFQALRTNPGA